MSLGKQYLISGSLIASVTLNLFLGISILANMKQLSTLGELIFGLTQLLLLYIIVLIPFVLLAHREP